MQEVNFSHSSTVLVDVLGYERSEQYLEIATRTYHWATTWLIYGLILVSISLLVLILGFLVISDKNSNFQNSLLTNNTIAGVLISTITFTLFGIYLMIKSERIRRAAKKQADLFETALLNSQLKR
jgi:cell shape-determining protein MreD